MSLLTAEFPRQGSILLVEDSRDVRVGMQQLLELYGYLVVCASDAEQALARLTSMPRPFALMLLDLRLPGALSGYDVRARQLADPALAGVPTVVITALEPPPDEREALHSDGWLDKPFRSEALLNMVRRFVVPGE